MGLLPRSVVSTLPLETSPWTLENMSPSLPSFEKENVGQITCLRGVFHKTIRVVMLCRKFEASNVIQYPEIWV